MYFIEIVILFPGVFGEGVDVVIHKVGVELDAPDRFSLDLESVDGASVRAGCDFKAVVQVEYFVVVIDG